MNDKTLKHKSKFLSLVLRHRPEVAGVTLDDAGWVDVDALLAGAAKAGTPITRAELAEIVRDNDKQRFALSDDGARIRASQGHSVEVDLGYEPAEPPAVLYHGTADHVLPAIRRDGLLKRKRHHVHLSAARATAEAVGRRHGRAVVIEVDAARMRADGHAFFVSANGVWLAEHVPAAYLTFPA
ncbi:MAG TPA: RNA 2'-phosphotransferase [Humisphaera sp.]